MSRVLSKQKVLPVAALLSGATIWGLIWYPYRLLQQVGVSGTLSAFLTYAVALALGLAVFRHSLGEIRAAKWILALIGLSAGWTNFAFILAVIDGEIMRVMLLFYLAPLWTVILSRLLLGEVLAPSGVVVMLLSFCGAMTMLWQPERGWPVPENSAEWLGLSSGMTFALSNVLVRKAQDHSIPIKTLSVCAGVALITLLGILIEPDSAGVLQSIEGRSWVMMGLVGLALFGASLTVQYGMTHTTANQTIVLFLFELVVAAVAAYYLAGEFMSLREWLGGAMIISATMFSGRLAQK